MTKNRPEQEGVFLNAAIGFLSILLFILITALVFRMVYPRIQNERAELDSILISDIIQLEVLNGCGVPGVAKNVTSTLRSYGFDVVESGNFDNFDMTETFIISRNGNMKNAVRVAEALGLSEDRVLLEEAPDFYLDATLVIGADYPSLNLY